MARHQWRGRARWGRQLCPGRHLGPVRRWPRDQHQLQSGGRILVWSGRSSSYSDTNSHANHHGYPYSNANQHSYPYGNAHCHANQHAYSNTDGHSCTSNSPDLPACHSEELLIGSEGTEGTRQVPLFFLKMSEASQ